MDIGLEINKIYQCKYQDKIHEIKDNSIDMVLTDIPYLLHKDSNQEVIKNYNKKKGNSEWEDPNKLEWDVNFDVEDYITQCCRILKPKGSIIVWASWQQLYQVDKIIYKSLGKLKGEPRIGVWKKTNPPIINMDKMAIQPYELFIWNRKGKKAVFNNINGKYIDNETKKVRQNPEKHYFEQSAPSKKRLEGKHPTSKPESIFEWLLLTYTNIGDIVFDGCIGGGTTAVVCYQNRRNFIGFECKKEYCEIAKERLDILKKDNWIEK